MKGAVISGGGSWGSGTVGDLVVNQPQYDFCIGTSTGCLIAPFVILQDWDTLRIAYTTISQREVFDVNPFTKTGNLNIFKAIFRVLRGKKSLGENQTLLKTIRKFFTEDKFNLIKKTGKQLYVVVCNYSYLEKRKEFISIYDCDYDRFTRYMHASCSVPVVCSIQEIDGMEYVDGGVTEGIPLAYALMRGCSKVDVYIHDTIVTEIQKKESIKNVFHNFMRTFNWMREEIKSDDYAGFSNGKTVQFRMLPYKPDYNILLFCPTKMRNYYDKCYAYHLNQQTNIK